MKVKRLTKTAQIPTRAYEKAAGLDLYADGHFLVVPGHVTKVKTGIAIELPATTVGQVWPRSGLAGRGVSVLAGIIDEDFRGEVCVMLASHCGTVEIKPGDRVAQLLIEPTIKVEPTEVPELADTDRGDRGFGSSGE